MKKKDYLILLAGIIVIAIIFYKFREFEDMLVLMIIAILVLTLLIFFFLMIREEYEFKNRETRAIYIFSCCFINDDVNFSKLYKVISRNISNDSFKMTAKEFINYLKDKEMLIKLEGKETIEEISEKINFLLQDNDLDLVINSDLIKKLDNRLIDVKSKNKCSIFIQELNIIAKMIREKGYELVQIYPASMYKNKEHYYFIVVPINRLLDLGEIGLLG